jgi:nucleotide-binding universal stress UspA family protein
MRNIVVATDGSDGSGRALKVAAELAKAVAATLSIMTVSGARPVQEQKQVTRVEGGLADAADALERRILSDAEQEARSAGVASLKTNLAWGDPAQAIIECVLEKEADALVVGRRGRGQLAGLLLGSVSQKLASLAPCVVIVVP